MLTASCVNAGAYSFTYSGGQSVSVGVNVPGGTYTQPYTLSSGGTYGGGASTSWATASASATSSGDITATATWHSSGSGDTPPASVIVVETCTASWSGTGVSVPTGHCDNGIGNAEIDKTTPPIQPGAPTTVLGVSKGVHYRVQANPGYSFTLTASPYANVADQGQITPGGGGTSVSYSASILNGNWDGPYYFHYGNYYGEGSESPWAHNTVGATPAITDIADNTHIFSLSGTANGQCEVLGSITPVWYWNGPNLGGPPPPFDIFIVATALARDYNDRDPYVTPVADDGIGNTPQSSPPGSAKTSDWQFQSVTVQSDVYAPGEGNGFWAIGKPIRMNAFVDETDVYPPFNLYTSVELDASIESGRN